MRRSIIILCTAVVLALLFALGASAGNAEHASGDYSYILLEDGTAALTACRADDTELILPAELDGHTVTAFFYGVFPFDCPAVTIRIPTGVRRIEPMVFSSCAGLTAITAASGNPAFSSRDGVLYTAGMETLVSYPAGKEGSFTVPDGVTQIGAYAFAQCERLSSVTLPEGVTSIREGAFYCCFDLQSLTVPKSVTSISASSVFTGCFSLTDVFYAGNETEWKRIEGHDTLPDGVTVHTKTAAAARASGSWKNLIWSLDEDGVLTVSGSGEMADFTSLSSDAWLAYQTEIVRAEILERVTGIGAYAFNGCVNLQEVSLPENTEKIGAYAFDGCENLRSVLIPAGVTQIGTGAFYGCSRLTALTVPDDHPVFSSVDGILYSEDRTQVLCCPNGKTGEVSLPASVTGIGNSAFYGCSRLTRIALPESLTQIGAYAFFGCGGLTNVQLPDGLKSIGSNAFYGCAKLTSMIIPAGVTDIGTYAFCSCSGLTNAVLPAGLTAVRGYTFCDCAALESVAIPFGVTRIDAGAFIYCAALRSVTIPSSVTAIGGFAFDSCTSLSDVYFAGREDRWSRITVSSGNEALSRARLHCVQIDLRLPDGTEEIGKEAFAGITDGLTVYIPGSVASIDPDAFSGVTGLTICGVPGSRAEEFAEDAGYAFIPMID